MKFNFFNSIFYLCFKETNNVFSSTFAESTARLKAMGKKLGSCIEKARPYYEAQELARTSQLECQRAAVQYQRANGTAFTSLFSSIVINYSCNVSKTIIFLNEWRIQSYSCYVSFLYISLTYRSQFYSSNFDCSIILHLSPFTSYAFLSSIL